MDHDDVFGRLRVMVADSLAIDASTITLQSRLIDDLGADSLDFVDLMFAIEREFGVKLREADLNFLTRLDFSSPTVMRDGFLTEETLATLTPLLPALRDVPDPARITPGRLFSMLTVETLCLMIERRRIGEG
jgi:acyl carrier protein